MRLTDHHAGQRQTQQGLRNKEALKTEALQQVRKSRITTKTIEGRINFEKGQQTVATLVPLLDPCESLVLISETCIDHSYQTRRDVASLGAFLQLINHLLRLT